ncbi:MAG TPA: Uma2 family endonuclease [Verrucomicrobiae bacterium]|nr:Uma2 family endonuclease [Verrucomicrobiae bacterium]
MEAAKQAERFSVPDYLAGEERSDVRHEYIGGAIYAMAGASDEHIALCMNLAFALRPHLHGSPCRVQMSDGKVHLRILNEDVFYYSDVMVFCDPRDTDRYFKRFPRILVEVLSDTTETIDRREKFLSYRQIETLEEYVLIAQDKNGGNGVSSRGSVATGSMPPACGGVAARLPSILPAAANTIRRYFGLSCIKPSFARLRLDLGCSPTTVSSLYPSPRTACPSSPPSHRPCWKCGTWCP